MAKSAGVVDSFRAGSIAAAVGDSTVSVELKKNGTSVLAAAIALDNANTAYVPEAGSVNTPAYVAGDVFTVQVSISAGTGTLPQGVFASAVFQEAA